MMSQTNPDANDDSVLSPETGDDPVIQRLYQARIERLLKMMIREQRKIQYLLTTATTSRCSQAIGN